jgi:protein tyrosine/serine phosphatase
MNKKGINISDAAQSVNFREICVGNIAPDTLYRSSHPIQDNRQKMVISMLAAKYHIAAVINLSDTFYEVKRTAVFAPWYNSLFTNNRIIALGMDFSVTGYNFHRKLKKALQFIITTDGPWLIHCHAGVDRTGFFSMVLEALMGATINEIADDYLLSFSSIFEPNVVMRLLSVMGGPLVISNQNLQSIAGQYLRDKIGLSGEEVDLLKKKLANKKDIKKPQDE